MVEPLLPGRPGLYLSMVQYGLKYNRKFAHENYRFFSGMLDYLGDVAGLRTLDVGCGKSFWLTLLLHSAGANVTGIDTEVVKPGFSREKYTRMLRQNGLERTLRTLIWDRIFARPYYTELASISDFPLVFDGIDLRAMNSNHLDFPENTFDLVVSHEVFEHIANVDETVKQLHRIMKPGGRTYIYIHNYASLSGGHHIAWKYPDTEPSSRVPAWDHLRENRYPDIPSWLNRKRIMEYREIFEPYFTVKDWIPTTREGEKLLTPALRDELSGYSEEELVTKGFIIVATPEKPS